MLFPSTKFIVFVIFCVIGSVKLETFLIWQKINICKCKCVLLVFALFTTIAPFFNFSNNISSCDTPAYFKGMSSFCSWKTSHCNAALKCHVFQVSVLSIFFFNLNILMNNTMNSQVYPTLIFTSIGAPFLDVSSSIVKWEYRNLFKWPELSMLLWKANSLANKEQGLVRSSCFILVFKHSDWHSLEGFLKAFIYKGKGTIVYLL